MGLKRALQHFAWGLLFAAMFYAFACGGRRPDPEAPAAEERPWWHEVVEVLARAACAQLDEPDAGVERDRAPIEAVEGSGDAGR